jgi:hypothetical protein
MVRDSGRPVTLAGVVLALPETAASRGSGRMLRGYPQLLRSRTFCGYLFGGAFTSTTFFVYLPASRFIFTDMLHRPATEVWLFYLFVPAADPSIFAIGDCTACPREGHTTPVPPRAQAAHQQAAHLVKQLRRRLAGQKLEPFVYRDFGSLVSLGKYSTVGSLMGFVVGKNIFIEGYFARLMYRSLHKMHEYALRGGGKVFLGSLARGLSRHAEPQVKLH